MIGSQMETVHALMFALGYPFPRPSHEFIYFEGETVWLLELHPEAIGKSIVKSASGALMAFEDYADQKVPDFDLADYTPVVGHGSNASPVQLRRKFHGKQHIGPVPVLRVRLFDTAVLFANQIASYGSIPTTISHFKDTSVEVFVTFLSPEAVEEMHLSEGIGQHYCVDQIGDFKPVNKSFSSNKPVLAYHSLTGHLPAVAPHEPVHNPPFEVYSQWDIQQFIIEKLGLDLSVESFILENIRRPDLRQKREEQLMQEFGP